MAWDYASTAGVDAQLSILIDPLSVFMICVVSGVSMLIHLYSVAYMAGDRGYTRFFAYLNFFVFSMLLLVLAANFVLLIIGWAFVGAASYFLISFWYRRTTATAAGIKAFVINVLGDVGLVLGTFFILRGTGSVDFLKVFAAVDDSFATNEGNLVAGCILLLVGAFAKSAQVPLHTWLPDAMEGPTPVSALIHAATMVTAGVYLIARMHPLFEHAPAAADVGAVIGCVTMVVAATIGLVVTDLKRVIAYSTMSQIGYMVMAVSSRRVRRRDVPHDDPRLLQGAALHGGRLGDRGDGRQPEPGQDVAASSARCASPTAAWWSAASRSPGSRRSRASSPRTRSSRCCSPRTTGTSCSASLGYIGALLTAIYTFRMIFRAFWGEPCEEALELERGHLYHPHEPTNPATGEVEDTDVGFPGPDHHIAEREVPMRVAMGALAVLATIGGLIQIGSVNEMLHKFLEPTFADSSIYESLEPSGTLTIVGMLVGAAVGALGIFIAYTLYVRSPERPAAIQARLPRAARLLRAQVVLRRGDRLP